MQLLCVYHVMQVSLFHFFDRVSLSNMTYDLYSPGN
jgi:hypothetical protein